MIDIREVILSDAIETAIEAEKRAEALENCVVVLSCLCGLLIFALILVIGGR